MVSYTKQLFPFTDLVEQTRIKAAEAALPLARIAHQGGDEMRAIFTKGLEAEMTSERSALVLHILDRAKKVLDG